MEMQFEEHWKKFEENELSHSETHYLLSIYSLSSSIPSLRAVDLSNELKVSRNAVSLQLKKLAKKGFIKIDDNSIQLSKKGRRVIEKIANKRHLMIVFLSEVLGLPLGVATSDSCKIEHLLSDDTGNALLKFMHFLRSDNKAVLNFLKEFQEFYVQCNPDIGCGLCDNINLMEDRNETL